jgi:hypothetical protein
VPIEPCREIHRIMLEAEGDRKIVQTMASVPVPADLLEPGSPIVEALSTGSS